MFAFWDQSVPSNMDQVSCLRKQQLVMTVFEMPETYICQDL